jgi:hypothetical protein
MAECLHLLIAFCLYLRTTLQAAEKLNAEGL